MFLYLIVFIAVIIAFAFFFVVFYKKTDDNNTHTVTYICDHCGEKHCICHKKDDIS